MGFLCFTVYLQTKKLICFGIVLEIKKARSAVENKNHLFFQLPPFVVYTEGIYINKLLSVFFSTLVLKIIGFPFSKFTAFGFCFVTYKRLDMFFES